MRIIAHRGLLNGPDTNLENTIHQISYSLKLGFDCEIDVWYDKNNWYLGHDKPTHKVCIDFLSQSGLWIHAKNIQALYELAKTKLNYFWHQEDDYTLTSHNYIWTYPGKTLTDSSIYVLPEWQDPEFKTLPNIKCFGICSDYVEKIKELI
jgi:hypothetical protein